MLFRSVCSAKKQTCFDGHCGSHGDGCFASLKQHFKDFDYEQLCSDHCWPEQYSRESMRRVNYPFGVQMRNGTETELTIWSHYFETDDQGRPTARLNEAGIRRIRYFARRKPFVIPALQLQTSFDQNLDAKRINTVVETAQKSSLEDVPWVVSIVDRAPTGLYGPEGPKAITKMVGPEIGRAHV